MVSGFSDRMKQCAVVDGLLLRLRSVEDSNKLFLCRKKSSSRQSACYTCTDETLQPLMEDTKLDKLKVFIILNEYPVNVALAEEQFFRAATICCIVLKQRHCDLVRQQQSTMRAKGVSGLCYPKSLVLIAGPGLCYTVTDILKRIIINILEHHSYSCFQKCLQNYSKMLLCNLHLLPGNAPFKQGIGNIALAFLGSKEQFRQITKLLIFSLFIL